MKIIQINTIYGAKSTGRTCLELERFLRDNGHECITAFGHGPNKNRVGYRINTTLEYKLHNILSRLIGLEGYFSIFATLRLVKFIKKYKPDLIHLRNLHGHYLNFPIFFRYLRKAQIPLVVHLHDCWICSGKCTHPTIYNCDRWLSSCQKCPAKKDYPQSYFFDFSKKMFKDKMRWFDSLSNVHVIGVSQWVAQEGAKSYLKKFPVSFIYNWIDTNVFYPRKRNVFDRYGINRSKFNIICVSASWDNTEKFKELLQLSDQIDEGMHIIAVGKCNSPIQKDNITYINFTESTDVLAELYSFCDVYVHFSTADTFGKVIAEALACGTPAVVYNATACPEVVGEKCGFSVEKHKVSDIYNALTIIREKGKESYSKNCTERVKAYFDYEKNCQQTMELYLNMIGDNQKL